MVHPGYGLSDGWLASPVRGGGTVPGLADKSLTPTLTKSVHVFGKV